MGMSRLLGLPRPRMTLVEDMGGPAYVRRLYPTGCSTCLVADLPVDNLPSSCLSRRDNLALLSLGVESLGQVGVHSLGFLFRDFIGRLDDRGWWVFVDGGRWLEETGEMSLDVLDGVLEVDRPDARGAVTSFSKPSGFLGRQNLPVFPVVNRVESQDTMDQVESGPVPLAFFPDLDVSLSVPPDGRGLPFPRDFLIPLRGLWEAMMSNFGSPHASRVGFGGGSALRS